MFCSEFAFLDSVSKNRQVDLSARGRLYETMSVSRGRVGISGGGGFKSLTVGPSSSDNASDDSGEAGVEELDKILLEPYTYILQVPGKNIRTKLCDAFDYWLKVPKEKLTVISELAQMLHNASLLIDDIEDNSHLRRGIPVAHSIYGVANTINAANFIYFLGLEKALTLDHPAVTRIYTQQLLELHRGQGMDIYWRDSATVPTLDEYKNMVIRKTGGLFGLAIRLMQLFSPSPSPHLTSSPDALKHLTDTLGLYFQIRDDFANLTSATYADNKSFAEDLSEGKFSFPIIHGIRHGGPASGDNSQILYIVKQRTEKVEVKQYCVKLLHDYGSFEYTKKELIQLEESASDQIKALGGNPGLEGVVKALSTVYRTADDQLSSSGGNGWGP